MLYYDEPWPGLDKDGNEVTCNRQIGVTEEDAIAFSRYIDRQHREKGYKGPILSEQQLLEEFIISNWAYHKPEGVQ